MIFSPLLVGKKILHEINMLSLCLNFVQLKEPGLEQGIFGLLETFSLNLSTESVDVLPLALGPRSLQQGAESMPPG
jgi:hypothetical protein